MNIDGEGICHVNCRSNKKGISAEKASPEPVIGEWTCSFCKCSNISTRTFCITCNLEKGIQIFDQIDENSPRWDCNFCFYSNHPFSTECFQCWNLCGTLPEPELKSGTNFSAEAKINDIDDKVAKVCGICDCVLNEENKYLVATECRPFCKECFANWITVQVAGGNANSLKCPCPNQHRLRYVDFRSLADFIPGATKEKYHAAKRGENVSPTSILYLACPACDTTYDIYPNQPTYLCVSPSCTAGNGIPICCKHNTHFSRVNLDDKHYLFDLKSPRCCKRCLEEAGGSTAVNSVMHAISEAFCDRCPSCKGFVGEPEDFDSCMCLKCNHCPQSFCAFCYNFASDWTSTHYHVRHCRENPRENYFAESEAVWRRLMRDRRLRLLDVIIASSDLTEEQKHFVREKVEKEYLQHV